MAGPARFTVILDACVLYPAVVRDALMSLHFEGFFASKWTARIENEFVRSLLRDKPDMEEGRLRRTCEHMHANVPDWEVRDFEDLIGSLELPDPDDRHVLAAAIRGHADCIVTTNLVDFPPEYLARWDLEAIHPDDFIMLQLGLNPVQALKAFKSMRLRLRNPPMDAERFCDNFRWSGLLQTATRLSEDLELL